MKQIYLIAIAVLTFNFSFSAPVIKATSTGNWNAKNSWNLDRTPQNGDTVMIPSGITINLPASVSLNNVYVKVYGTLQFTNWFISLTLDNNSVVAVYAKGVIQSTSIFQSISIGNNTPFNSGWNFGTTQLTGPQIASSVTGNTFSSFTPMPVKFVGFTATQKNNDVLLQWSTAQEINADVYEVQRSYDATSWNTVGYVNAVGNTSNLTNYSYTDKNVSSKTVYYRIKQVDLDRQFTYTDVKSVKINGTVSNNITIASIQNKVLLQFPQEVKGSVLVRFVSLSGQVMDQQTISNVQGQVVLNSRVSGNYIIAVSNGQDLNVARQIIL